MQSVTVHSPSPASRGRIRPRHRPEPSRSFSPVRGVCESAISGEATAISPREGSVRVGPRRVCGRRSGGGEQPAPVATEDEAAANPTPSRFLATAYFVFRFDHRRVPWIRKSSLRFLFFPPKSSDLQAVRSRSP
jgi:hypothetical protein